MEKHTVRPTWTKAECQELLAFIPDATLVVNQQGIILAANQETARIFGYTCEELVGQPLNCLLPDRFHTSHQQHLADYVQQPWPRPMGLSLDLTARHKQGHEIAVMVSLVPWDTEQGVVITAFIRDVTQRKAMETALQEANDRLEQEVARQTAELRQTNQQLREEIIERRHIEEKLRLLTAELTERQQHLQRELQSLDQYSQSTPSAITAQAFNLLPLAESLPAIFDDLTNEYGALLDIVLEAKMYRITEDLTEKLRSLAERLGAYNAGPHDVVLLHSNALKIKVSGAPYAKASVYFEEGRLLVLKLMGYLAAYYRSYSLNFFK